MLTVFCILPGYSHCFPAGGILLSYLAIFLFLPLAILSCSEPQPESLEAAVARHLDNNEYESALELLRISDSEADPSGVKTLRVQVHLAYAHYLTHGADHLAMASRMADALRHYRRVIQLDPGNSQALTHIELIEGIYEQMGRDIPDGVAE